MFTAQEITEAQYEKNLDTRLTKVPEGDLDQVHYWYVRTNEFDPTLVYEYGTEAEHGIFLDRVIKNAFYQDKFGSEDVVTVYTLTDDGIPTYVDQFIFSSRYVLD